MRIRAGFAASPPGEWTINDFNTVEDLWSYIESHHWLPVLSRNSEGELKPRVLNTRLLTTITVLHE